MNDKSKAIEELRKKLNELELENDHICLRGCLEKKLSPLERHLDRVEEIRAYGLYCTDSIFCMT